jgi:hypothetical protein
VGCLADTSIGAQAFPHPTCPAKTRTSSNGEPASLRPSITEPTAAPESSKTRQRASDAAAGSAGSMMLTVTENAVVTMILTVPPEARLA